MPCRCGLASVQRVNTRSMLQPSVRGDDRVLHALKQPVESCAAHFEMCSSLNKPGHRSAPASPTALSTCGHLPLHFWAPDMPVKGGSCTYPVVAEEACSLRAQCSSVSFPCKAASFDAARS